MSTIFLIFVLTLFVPFYFLSQTHDMQIMGLLIFIAWIVGLTLALIYVLSRRRKTRKIVKVALIVPGLAYLYLCMIGLSSMFL
jgi:hypothetical protein